ncbi:MAG: bis(5'-nucleosyl)-tetraphosphatase (symmetrical) YqeK [Eubacterium sp.]|nr:bis(5'-nucleosyl)-tetraphosphatase (symmetrical) YqeK [Eubacterium sp.]
MKKQNETNSTVNKAPDFTAIEQRLSKLQNGRRFQHTLGVTYTACALAMRYGCDLTQARTAGLLHDCAKHCSGIELREIASRKHISVTQFEREHTPLLHAKVGAYLARVEYGITDLSILEAIRWHTTGKPDMTLLEKIVFTADYIEPNRDRAPHLTELRELAFRDLDRCVCEILRDTKNYLARNPKAMDPMTLDALAYYESHTDSKAEEEE